MKCLPSTQEDTEVNQQSAPHKSQAWQSTSVTPELCGAETTEPEAWPARLLRENLSFKQGGRQQKTPNTDLRQELSMKRPRKRRLSGEEVTFLRERPDLCSRLLGFWNVLSNSEPLAIDNLTRSDRNLGVT